MSLSILMSSLVCLPFAAQQNGSDDTVQRRRSFVLVVNAKGQPWPSASIVCFYPGVQAYPELVPQDVVEATSDERGRAGVELRPGCGYFAWASQPLPDGTWRLSQATRVASGRPIRLAEWGTPRPKVRVRIAGLEAWGEEAPFRCFATSLFGWRQELMAKDGVVDVPPLPAPPLTVTVYGKAGLVLGSGTVQVSDSSSEIVGSSPDVMTIQVPPPLDLEIRLRDKSGAPAAGVRVLACDQGGHGARRVAEVGRTSVAGTFRMRGTGRIDPAGGGLFFLPQLRVLADRFADRQVHVFGKSIDQCPATSLEQGVLCHEVELQPGFTIRGRLLVGEKQPAAGTALLMYAMVSTGRGSIGSPTPKLVVVTDSAGKFEVPGCDPTIPYSLWASLDERSYATLAKLVASRLQRRLCLLADAKSDGAVLDLGDVRLDQLERWGFQMLEADGLASTYAMLWLEPAIATTAIPDPMCLDALGRGTVLAARGTLARAAAGGDTSFAWSELGERAPGEAIVLRSLACVPIGGQAVDESGKPCRGVLIQLWTRGVLETPHEVLFSRWYHDWVRKSRVTSFETTDERGVFRFEAVPGCIYQVIAKNQKNGSKNVAAIADATTGAVLGLRLILDSKQ